MSEAYSQIQPDSTGDKIRTVELTLLQPDGTRVTVGMQVMSITDSEGNIIGGKDFPINVDSKNITNLLEALLTEIRELKETMNISH
jgi:hypothetical protein